MGFDDLSMASWPVFRLTTVRVDFTRMAHQAAELLVQRLKDAEATQRHETYPVQLVPRWTHAAPSS